MRNQGRVQWEPAACLVLWLAVIDMTHGCPFLGHGGFLIPSKHSLEEQSKGTTGLYGVESAVQDSCEERYRF